MTVSSLLSFGDESLGVITNALKSAVIGQTLPHPVYHFTNIDGARGILRSRSLWATLATASTDTNEIRYALSVAKRLLQDSRVDCDPLSLTDLVPLLDAEGSELACGLGWRTFVVSFRTNADGHGHWKEYGDSGKGMALAFGMKPIVVPGTLFLPVIYERKAQEQLISQFVEASAALFRTLVQSCPESQRNALLKFAVQITALGIWTLAPLLKAQNFHVEQEWRLVVINAENAGVRHDDCVSTDVRIRNRGNRQIPYIELQYDWLPILRVELGAHAPIAENDPGLIQLLQNACRDAPIPITRSHVTITAPPVIAKT